MKKPHMVFCTILLFIAFSANSQVIQASQKTKALTCTDFFKAEELAQITLISDFKTLKSKKKKGVYQHAIAILHLSDKDSIIGNADIYARGNYRRELCQMPSLMVNFKTATPSELNGLKKMKMVCGCTSNYYNERLVLMEYLIYKIYNFLTPMSFKAKLVKMTYNDVNNKTKPYTQYAFFIEDVDDMAKRSKCREYIKKASSVLCDRSQMNIMTVFQYMIGNTDWSVPNYHNIKLIQLKSDSTSYPHPVPYDFDFSGCVNASYAFPNKELFGIEKVTDRFYRGHQRSLEEIQVTLQVFRDNKEHILSLIANFDLLDLKDRKTMIDYIEDFYSIISDNRKVKNIFVNGASH